MRHVAALDAIGVLWLGWVVYWTVAARAVKPMRWRESRASRLAHIVPLVLCAVLLMVPQGWPAVLRAPMLPRGAVSDVVGLLATACGMVVSIWARRHLGRNWSGTVTLKQDHTLIRSGPYRRVRHPIYSGILLALAGTAVVIGEWRGALAVALALVALIRKLRVEEARLLATFAEYGSYRSTTAALIPFVY